MSLWIVEKILIEHPQSIELKTFGSSPEEISGDPAVGPSKKGSFKNFSADNIDSMMFVKEDRLETFPILDMSAMHMIVLFPKFRCKSLQKFGSL